MVSDSAHHPREAAATLAPRAKWYARRTGWRAVTPLACAAAAALMVVSAINADGRELRPTRFSSLADVASSQALEAERLQDAAAQLQAEIEEINSGLPNPDEDLAKRVSVLRDSAGLERTSGAGVRISLDDAPRKARLAAGDERSAAIVHQQDIQAVANALWAGGAAAMTLQGQRVISTTGIKCVGNTVILHGVPYAPPYVIEAVGDPTSLQEALASSSLVRSYLDAVDTYKLGWEFSSSERVVAPAYQGTIALGYASVVFPKG